MKTLLCNYFSRKCRNLVHIHGKIKSPEIKAKRALRLKTSRRQQDEKKASTPDARPRTEAAQHGRGLAACVSLGSWGEEMMPTQPRVLRSGECLLAARTERDTGSQCRWLEDGGGAGGPASPGPARAAGPATAASAHRGHGGFPPHRTQKIHVHR